MANRGPSYGLSREIQSKLRAKFDMNQALECLEWIEQVIGQRLYSNDEEMRDHLDVARVLKSGEALCQLINGLQPGSVLKVNSGTNPFKRMENIEMFLNACSRYGMNPVDRFQTQDLYEAKGMYSVVGCIHALGSLARKNKFDGPTIGVKLADQNKRNFSEEQLREGHKIIGLQYGTNKGASQAGMTAYGKMRDIMS